MDYKTLNQINKENARQAFLEEKAEIRKIAAMKISSQKKQEKVNAVKSPIQTDDLSYLNSGVNVF